jgi:hypothetical protein
VPYPIAELITQDVLAALKQVSKVGGYSVTLKPERFKKGGLNSDSDVTAILSFHDDQAASDADTPLNYTAWLRPYWVLVYIYESDESDTPYDQRVDCVIADIGKAVMQDVTRGGHAQNTWMREPVRFDDPNDSTGVICNFDVLYRHLEDDPYSQS